MSQCNSPLALAYKDSSEHSKTNNEIIVLLKEAGNKKGGIEFAASLPCQVRTVVSCPNWFLLCVGGRKYSSLGMRLASALSHF